MIIVFFISKVYDEYIIDSNLYEHYVQTKEHYVQIEI